MILPSGPSKCSKTLDVQFPKLGYWNPMSKTAVIAAIVDKKRILCGISLNLLQQRFGPGSVDQPMRIVAEHRPKIEAAAQRLIESKAFEEDGSVVIRAQDI